MECDLWWHARKTSGVFSASQVDLESSGYSREREVLGKVRNDFAGLANAHACLNECALRACMQRRKVTDRFCVTDLVGA